MSTRVVDQVDDWTKESFAGGYGELQRLMDREFSGVVRAAGAELYMTRGVVVGIRSGGIEDFEDASGSLYEAPAAALPLLAIMQERSEEVRAKYYSEKTSIAKVDQTLSDGGFTGYIELSENVLSGDYYLVYQAGKSMSVAFVGESGKLLTEEEAFETADDEVGIFQVRQVDIDPIEIPEPETPEPTGGRSSTTAGDSTGGSSPDPDGTRTDAGQAEETVSAGSESAGTDGTGTDKSTGTARTDQQSSASTGSDGQSVTADDESGTEATTQREPADPAERRDRTGTAGGTDHTPDAGGQPRSESQAETTGRADTTAGRHTTESDAVETGQSPTQPARERADPGTERQRRTETGRQGDRDRRREADSQRESTRQTRQSGTSQQSRGRQTGASQGRGGAGTLETRSIPSIDPDNTSVPEETAVETPSQQPDAGEGPDRDPVDQRRRDRAQSAGSHPPADRQGSSQSQPRTDQPTTQPPADQQSATEAAANQQTSRAEERSQPSPRADEPDPDGQIPSGGPPPVDDERLSELEDELERKAETIDQLESEVATATQRRDELESELESVRAERDELAGEVERLEDELERLESELGAAGNAERRLTTDEALAGTDIFVRYRSKGKATLKKAHGGSTRKEEVNDNLRLEKHTQFDADSVAVGGQAYEEFLEGTLEFQFVRWIVRELLFEIRETNHEKALRNLYDVLPLVDRAELSGVVEVTYTEDGQETKTQESFDVVLRDRMGHPLLAANLNDSREATTEAMMERLITSAERVGQANEDFSAAFLVTESFFDPGALEVTSEATQGGLLSRDKRKSFVNLSRKQGYHLCLVEARSENFHLAVPEL